MSYFSSEEKERTKLELILKAHKLLVACEGGDKSGLDEGVSIIEKLHYFDQNNDELEAGLKEMNSKDIIQRAMKEPNEAIIGYSHIVNSHKTSFLGYLNQACELFLQKQFENALDVFNKAMIYKTLIYLIRLEPKSSEIHFHQGFCFYVLENYEEALKELKEALISDHTNIRILRKIGDCFYKLNKVTEANKYYKAVLKISPDDYESYLKIAENLLLKLKNYAESNKYFNKLIQLRPNEIHNYLMKADCLIVLGEWQKVIDTYDIASRIKSLDSDYIVNFNRANSYINLPNHNEQALKYADLCISMNPNDERCYIMKRELLRRLGR